MNDKEYIQAMKDKERENRRKLYSNKRLFDYMEARQEHIVLPPKEELNEEGNEHDGHSE